MKYVALLSGGKDSCYNLLHCSRNGHHLVAAASLGPEHGKEELDSYLYQTVGQDAIEFVARALDVPLYRRVISGAAVEQRSEYGGRSPTQNGGVQGDETEDLFMLLSTVKNAHPDILGVSVGAILSNYQRVRVEHVCRRLSLTPLCYLWQRDQAELLDEMINAGMEAVLIKVAGIGLTAKHLGKTLAEMQQTLVKLNNLYGSHICGEGGEYESLTLDCSLFKYHIKLTETEIVIHSDNDFATVAYLRIKGAVLEQKSTDFPLDLIVPPLLSPTQQAIYNVVTESLSAIPSSAENGPEPSFADDFPSIGACSKQLGQSVAISNISRTTSEIQSDVSIEEEVTECFQLLQGHLAKYSLQLSHIAYINILLSSMEHFARMNAIYAKFFGASPPARACIAVDLPPPLRVKLDCIGYAEKSPPDRQALHVQGLSYWAPANIGPYSQAITVDQRIFVSGQIGLVPSNLSLPAPPSLALETALSFQHVERVVTALNHNSGGGWEGHVQGIIYWLTDTSNVPHVRKASQSHVQDTTAPTLFVVVPALPKGALVEKQALYHTGQCLDDDDDNDEVLRSVTPKFHQGVDGSCVHWEISRFEENSSAITILCFRGSDPEMAHQDIPQLGRTLTTAHSIRLFYRPHRVQSFSQYYDCLFEHVEKPPITPIPCRFISSRDDDDWDFAMCIMGS
ncbi:hypothetical protein B0H21DRAFT_185984 [Amylocystis lapponica]|nr:hypothetical protein B0H21DRAFT_185984 [Amylocystis lapponica]